MKKIFFMFLTSILAASGILASASDGTQKFYSKKISIAKDDLKLELDSREGTFCIYAINEAGKEIPLLSKGGSSPSSYFCLKVGNRIYRLVKSSKVRTSVEKTPSGAQLVCYINNVAQVVVDFSFMPSVYSSTRVDVLRVTVYAVNLTGRMQDIAVKGIFDTLLGEKTPAHFSTAAHTGIKNETQFNSMDGELWVRSNDDSAAVQFIFSGNGVSSPESVHLANMEVIETSPWIPSVKKDRSFSVRSYDNSAMAVNWKPAYLDSFRTDAVVFYITVASDGRVPAGREFIADLDSGRVYQREDPYRNRVTDVAAEPYVLSDDEIRQQDEISSRMNYKVRETVTMGSVRKTSTYDGRDGIGSDMERARKILEKVRLLESSKNEISSEEISRLNDEMDELIERMGGGAD